MLIVGYGVDWLTGRLMPAAAPAFQAYMDVK